MWSKNGTGLLLLDRDFHWLPTFAECTAIAATISYRDYPWASKTFSELTLRASLLTQSCIPNIPFMLGIRRRTKVCEWAGGGSAQNDMPKPPPMFSVR